MGPSALRIAGIEAGIERLGSRFIDRGNIAVGDPRGEAPADPSAKYLEPIAASCAALADSVQEVLGGGPARDPVEGVRGHPELLRRLVQGDARRLEGLQGPVHSSPRLLE